MHWFVFILLVVSVRQATKIIRSRQKLNYKCNCLITESTTNVVDLLAVIDIYLKTDSRDSKNIHQLQRTHFYHFGSMTSFGFTV